MPTIEEIKKSPTYAKYAGQAQPAQQKQPQEFKTNFMSWMDRLMRPTYASAALAKETIMPGEEYNPGEAIWGGLTGKTKETYGDVLGELGWQPTTKIGKFARGVAGFGLDVALDPLTYIPFGRGIKYAAKRIPGAVKTGQAIRATKPVQALGKAFVPGFRPTGVSPENWTKLMNIKRKATAIQRIGNTNAVKFAGGILDDLKKAVRGGGIDDIGVKSLLESVEKRSLSAGLPDSVQPIWQKLTSYADDIAKRRQGIGKTLLDDQDYNFWLHTLSETERVTLKRTGMDIGLRDWTTNSASDISRKYVRVGGKVVRLSKKAQQKLIDKGAKIEQATIGEINQALGKDFFSTDIPFTAYQMGKRISRQESGTFFLKNIEELGSPNEITGWVKSTAPELKGLWFNPQIAKEIDLTRKAFVNEEVTKGFLKTFDGVQNYWKKWTLGPFPAYHFRNMIGNTWNNYLGGVVDPGVYSKAASIQRRVGSGLPVTSWERRLIEKAEAHGVLEHGWFGSVLGKEGAPRYFKQSKTFGKKIADIGAIPAEYGLRAGRVIENNARLAHFIDKVKKGWSYDEAALSVKKYLFDYTEITPFEANVMRRLMPFYTWSRKNIPLQVEHIFKKPGKTIAPVEKARRELAGGREPERKYLPQFLAERYPFRVGKPERGKARYFPLESWLPIADVGKLARPAEAITELMTPAIKLPTELLINRSFYFKRPIEKYKGERKKFLGANIPAKSEYALRNIRLLNELNRLFQKGKPTEFEAGKIDKTLRILTGIKTYPQRIKEMKRWAIYNIDKQIFELKKGYNRAIRNKNRDEAKRIKKTISKLENIK